MAASGTSLGPYRLLSELGSGGMGTVYLAATEAPAAGLPAGRRVAVKILHPHLLATPGVLRRFLREAELGMRVRHENLVPTLAVAAEARGDHTAHYLVMEYVEGRTLRRLLEELGRVPEALLREIARQAAAGLAAIHAIGVLHRDLKPENILITQDDRVRIMDLGVAKLLDATADITGEGNFAGSLLYASPEPFLGQRIGPASDLYSLGVVLYELATGTNPFAREDARAIIHAHLHAVPAPLDEADPEISPFFAAVVAALLAKAPPDRFASAESLGAALEGGERSAWWVARERSAGPRPAGIPPIPVRRETTLRGRGSELAALREAWAGARVGRGRVVLVEGETGIGKTRLVDAFVRGLEGDAHVLYGSHPPGGGRGGVAEAVTSRFGESDLERALAERLTVTPSLVASFAAWLRHEAPPAGEAPLSPDALDAVFGHLLRAMAAERPVVWIVEDLHHAPPEGLRVALALARAAAGVPAVVILTARPELSETTLAPLGSMEHASRVALGRLSPREVIELLRESFRSPALAERLGGKIAYKSDGVPFFIFEMIRGLREGGFLARDEGGRTVATRAIEDIEVPSAVRDLIAARLAELSDEERTLLDAAAVQGYEFDPSLLCDVLDLKRIVALQRLAAIERRSGIVRAAGPLYRFDHHQIREVLYEALAEPLAREYHTLTAAAIERAGGAAKGARAHALASHHLRGSRPAAALPALDAAFEFLERSARHASGAELAARALAEPELLAGAARFDVLLRRAAFLERLGNQEPRREALVEALSIAEQAGEPLRLARAHRTLAHCLQALGRGEEAAAHANEALEKAVAAGDLHERQVAHRTLGTAHFVLDRLLDAEEETKKALALAREEGDLDGELRATGNLGVFASVQGDPVAAIARHERCIELALQAGDALAEVRSRLNLGLELLQLGRHADAHASFQRGYEAARRIGDGPGEMNAMANLGLSLLAVGRPADALEWSERYLERTREAGDRFGESIALTNLADLFSRFGLDERARDAAERALALARAARSARNAIFPLHVLANLALRHGRLDEAERLLDELDATAAALPHPRALAQALLLRGRVREAAGCRSEAVALYRDATERGRALHLDDLFVEALARLAALDASAVGEARAACAAGGANLHAAVRVDVGHALWRATGDRAYLDEARRALEALRDRSPPEMRASMIERVPLHREVMAAS